MAAVDQASPRGAVLAVALAHKRAFVDLLLTRAKRHEGLMRALAPSNPAILEMPLVWSTDSLRLTVILDLSFTAAQVISMGPSLAEPYVRHLRK